MERQQKTKKVITKMFGLFNNKKIVKQLLDMIEYLIADNKKLRAQLSKHEHRQGLRFGGTQQLSKIQKKL